VYHVEVVNKQQPKERVSTEDENRKVQSEILMNSELMF